MGQACILVLDVGLILDLDLVGMGRACFFWLGSSPYFLDWVKPGLQILYLEPMRAKKILFEPTSILKNANESKNLLLN